MTQRMPKSSSAHGACSRLEPQPKFSPETRMVALRNGPLLRMNSGFSRPAVVVAHLGEQRLAEARALDGLEIVLGDDLVGIDIDHVEGRCHAGQCRELVHRLALPARLSQPVAGLLTPRIRPASSHGTVKSHVCRSLRIQQPRTRQRNSIPSCTRAISRPTPPTSAAAEPGVILCDVTHCGSAPGPIAASSPWLTRKQRAAARLSHRHRCRRHVHQGGADRQRHACRRRPHFGADHARSCARRRGRRRRGVPPGAGALGRRARTRWCSSRTARRRRPTRCWKATWRRRRPRHGGRNAAAACRAAGAASPPSSWRRAACSPTANRFLVTRHHARGRSVREAIAGLWPRARRCWSPPAPSASTTRAARSWCAGSAPRPACSRPAATRSRGSMGSRRARARP